MKAERISKLNKNRQGIRLVSFLFFSLSFLFLSFADLFLFTHFFLLSLFTIFFLYSFTFIWIFWFFLYYNNLLSHLFNSIHCLVLYLFFYLFLSYFYTSFTLYIFLSFYTCPIQLFLLLSLTHHNTTISVLFWLLHTWTYWCREHFTPTSTNVDRQRMLARKKQMKEWRIERKDSRPLSG